MQIKSSIKGGFLYNINGYSSGDNIMAFQRLDDIEIDGVKITNIYRECEYYHRTSGYNYIFCFCCDITDEDTMYNLCKKAFLEGKDHVKYDGTIGTYAVDNDQVRVIGPESNNARRYGECIERGCNWAYWVNEGNDD